MSRLSSRIMIGWMVLVLLVPAVRGGEEEQGDLDIIKRNDGKQVLPTKIVKDDFISVEGKIKNRSKIKVPSYLVESVHYGEWDSDFSLGLEKRKAGKDKTAAKLFRMAMQRMGNNKRAQEYCNYYIGDSFYRAGVFGGYTDKMNFRYDSAARYFARVIQLNPKSRFLLDSLIKKAVCLGEEGKLTEAEAAFKEAETRIKAYRQEVLQHDTGYLKAADRAKALTKYADASLMEKKIDGMEDKERDYQRALSAYKSAQTMSASSDKVIYGKAVDGELRVLQKMKEYGAARDRAKGIIEKFKQRANSDDYAMLPGAYIVIGMANYNEARDYLKKDQQLQANYKFAEARWNFLNVIVQFFENDEYVAKAHYFAGLCYERLQEQEKGGIERARRHWKAIVQSYPTSVFVKWAQGKLQANSSGEEEPEQPAKPEKGEAGGQEKVAPPKAGAEKGAGPAKKAGARKPLD